MGYDRITALETSLRIADRTVTRFLEAPLRTDRDTECAFAQTVAADAVGRAGLRGFKAVEELMGFTKHQQCESVASGSSGDCQEIQMTDLQSAINRLRQADEQCPDFWNTLQDRDADPQMLMDVVAVARAYVRKETVAHRMMERVVMEAMEDD